MNLESRDVARNGFTPGGADECWNTWEYVSKEKGKKREEEGIGMRLKDQRVELSYADKRRCKLKV